MTVSKLQAGGGGTSNDPANAQRLRRRGTHRLGSDGQRPQSVRRPLELSGIHLHDMGS